MSAYELVLIDLWSFLTNLEAKVQIFTINLDFNIDWPSTRFENSEVHFFGDDTGTQKTEISIFELTSVVTESNKTKNLPAQIIFGFENFGD